MKRLALIALALLAPSPDTGAQTIREFSLLAPSLDARAQTIREFLEASTVRWNTPTEPFRILGNIHYVGTDGVAVYLITSPEGHVLIDTERWSRFFEQNFRVAKWNLCRGYAAARSGSSVK